jgi:hypothetical protein
MQVFELVRYEEAKRALAACASIDEVKEIQDKAIAMQLYAKMSKEKDIEIYASTIKTRAVVRLGELIASMEKAEPFHRPPEWSMTKGDALKAAGIGRTTAQKYEKAASISEKDLETIIAEKTAAKEPISIKDVLNKVTPSTPKPAIPSSGNSEKETPPEMITIRQIEYDQMHQDLRNALDDNERLTKIMEADDKVAALLGQNKEMTQRLEICLRSNIAVTNECNEAKKAAKKWKALYEKEVKNDKPPVKELCVECRKNPCKCRQPGEEG